MKIKSNTTNKGKSSLVVFDLIFIIKAKCTLRQMSVRCASSEVHRSTLTGSLMQCKSRTLVSQFLYMFRFVYCRVWCTRTQSVNYWMLLLSIDWARFNVPPNTR